MDKTEKELIVQLVNHILKNRLSDKLTASQADAITLVVSVGLDLLVKK